MKLPFYSQRDIRLPVWHPGTAGGQISRLCPSHLCQCKHILLLLALAHTCMLPCFYKPFLAAHVTPPPQRSPATPRTREKLSWDLNLYHTWNMTCLLTMRPVRLFQIDKTKTLGGNIIMFFRGLLHTHAPTLIFSASVNSLQPVTVYYKHWLCVSFSSAERTCCMVYLTFPKDPTETSPSFAQWFLSLCLWDGHTKGTFHESSSLLYCKWLTLGGGGMFGCTAQHICI